MDSVRLATRRLAIMEVKLQQEVAAMLKMILFQVYLDLTKAYDALDRDRTLQTMKEYGVGSRLLCLIENYWKSQKIAPRQRGYHGPIITPERGVTQGGLFSCNEFNIMIDSVLRYWLTKVVPFNAEDGLGRTVEDMLTLFYADDGLLSAKDKAWLQKALNLLISLFERIGLKTKDSKTKMMICLPAVKASRMTEGAYKRRMTGEGDSCHERMRRRVACPECGDILQLRSLPNHRRVQHGISVTALPPPPPDAPPTLYFASVPRLPARDRDDVECPIPDCPGTARTPAGMREHFYRRHPQHSVCVRQEGSVPLKRCKLCCRHLTNRALNRHHRDSKECLQRPGAH